VFHYNKAHNDNQEIPPWVIKCRGDSYYVNHMTTRIGFSTKETPDNPHTKGSLKMKGMLKIVAYDDGTQEAVIY
jgi:hypothetical protein